MKKIIFLLMCFVGVLNFSSCSSDDDKSSESSALTLVKSDVKFTSNPGEGYIEFTSTSAVTATSSEEWCTATVSGSKVLVTVTGNTALESRNALVTLSAAGESVSVPVNQQGSLFRIGLDDDTYVVSGKAPQAISITAKISGDVQVSASKSWIHTAYSDGTITVDCDANTGSPRTGFVTITDGNNSTEFMVLQMSKNDGLDGSYTAYYYKSGNWVSFDVDITLSDDGTGINMDVLGFTLPLTYNESLGVYVLSNLNSLGKYSIYDIYNVNLLTNGSGLAYSLTSTSSIYDIYFEGEVLEDGTIGLFMSDDSPAASQGYTPYGIYLGAFSDDTFAGTILQLLGFQLYVNSEE